MELRHGAENVGSQHLPPREYWIFDPEKDEPFSPPVNGRGLVDKKAFVHQINETISPEYQWDFTELCDLHHVYHGEAFDSDVNEYLSPAHFRNRPSNKMLLPRGYHNWLHFVTREPEVPSKKSREYWTEAERVALALMRTIKESPRMIRIGKYDQEKLLDLQSSQLERILFQLEALHAISEDFQVIKPPEVVPATIEDIARLRQQLGKSAIRNAMIDELRGSLAIAA